jgi:hypothetical protein
MEKIDLPFTGGSETVLDRLLNGDMNYFREEFCIPPIAIENAFEELREAQRQFADLCYRTPRMVDALYLALKELHREILRTLLSKSLLFTDK